MLCREVIKPVHVDFILGPEKFQNAGNYVRRFWGKLTALLGINLKGTLQRRKKDYDVKLKHEIYQTGDFVYKSNSASKKGVSKKLLSIYYGPFIVTREKNTDQTK